MANERSITIRYLGDSTSAVKATKDVEGAAQKQTSSLGKVAKSAAALGASLGIASFGKQSVEAFKESELANNRLTASLEKMPSAVRPSFEELDKLAGALQKKTRFDDEAIKSGEAVLANFVQNGEQLKQLTPLVVDYAAKTGQDVPSAATSIGKALLGNAKALKSLGIDFKATGDKAADMAKIQELLSAKVGGFAEKEGKTAAGQAEILKNQFGELEEKAGGLLLPALLALSSAGLKVVSFFQSGSIASKAAAVGLGLLAAAMVTAKINTLATAAATQLSTEGTLAHAVATKLAAAGQWLLNVAMLNNPIGLVIVAIVALVAAVVLAYRHSETFRNIVQGAFAAVTTAGRAMWSFLQTAFAWIWFAFSHFTPLGLLITHFGLVRDVAVKTFDVIKSALGTFAAVWRTILNAIADVWNNTIGRLSFHVPSWVPVIGGKGFDVPKIPHFASGGIMPGAIGEPGLAILHGGERVIPAGAGGGGGVTLNFYGPVVGDRATLGRIFVEAVTEYERRSGTKWRSS